MEFKKWKFCLAYYRMNIMTHFDELYFYTDRKDHKELHLQHGESIFNFHFRRKIGFEQLNENYTTTKMGSKRIESTQRKIETTTYSTKIFIMI